MLTLSHTTGYAIKALAFLGAEDNEPTLIREISSRAGVPAPYLAKVVRRLRAAGLVEAKRGYKGGVHLVRPPEEITVLDIGKAIEGEQVVGDCLLGKVFCDDLSACPTHPFWEKTRAAIFDELTRWTLADIIKFRRDHASRDDVCAQRS